MDLSGIIFVVVAAGWAYFLIPMALSRNEDEAMSRSVDSFSSRVRVLGRGAAPVSASVQMSAGQAPAPAVHRVSRQAARAAARRRRRVLGLLLLVAIGLSVSSYLAYTPWWSTAIPTALILVFLVIARLTVRRQQLRRTAPVVAPVDLAPLTEAEMEPDLGREDTMGLSRAALAEAVGAPAGADGLWDPLPVTLPTYVTKARARRTVRTIELTQPGVTSSGHDESDSALAAEAKAAQTESAEQADPEIRKAAGA